MTGAVVAEHGSRLATRSRTGDVIVWDGTEEKPLQLLRGDPLWNDADLNTEQGSGITGCTGRTMAFCRTPRMMQACAERRGGGSLLPTEEPSLSGMSTARNRSPIPIIAPLKSSTLISPPATRRRSRRRCETGARFSGITPTSAAPWPKLMPRPYGNSQRPSQMISGCEAPRLAADARTSSPAVTKLLEHFASQARALRANALKAAPAASE